MRTFVRVFAVFGIVLASSSVRADEDGWRQDRDKDGIQVYTRAVPGWTIREFKGVTRIQARLSSLVAVIQDVRVSHELTDVVKESEIQQSESDTRFQVYAMMKMPWPVADRDILSQREVTQDKNSLTVTITDVAIPQGANPRRKDLIHIVKSSAQWTLAPTKEGPVLVEMRTLSDPAGNIPTSIINAMSVSTPFNTLSKLKELAHRAEYVHAKLPFIQEPAGNQ